MLDDLADVAGRPPRLLGPRVAQEVGQDAVEPAGLGPQRLHGGRPLVTGEPGLVGEQRGGVDDRGQRVADLVGHAGGQLAGGGQALGIAQPRVQALALAARALEHHDDHRERRQEVERDEDGVHGEVGGRARLGVHELGDHAMPAPQRQHRAQQPLAAAAGGAAGRRPEQDAGRHLDETEAHADRVGETGGAGVVGHRQHDGAGGAGHHVAPGQPVVPAVREGCRQREADGGHGGHLGGHARVLDVEHQHVDELETFGQRVGAPGQQQVLEEAHPV